MFKRLSFGALLAAALLVSLPARAQVTVDSQGGCHTLAGANIPCGTGLLPQPVGNGNPILGTQTVVSESITGTSGVMAAGLASAAPIFSCRYAPTVTTNIAVVRKVVISAGNAGTGFAAGVSTAQLVIERAFTVADTGGGAITLTTNNGKLRTSLATTGMGCRVSATATLTAGTQTADATPAGAVTTGQLVTAGATVFPPGTELFRADAQQEPIVLANNEGFDILATVPATGTWTFSVQVVFDELTGF